MRELYSALREANIPEDKALATVLAFEERFNAIDRRFNQIENKLEKLDQKVTILIGMHTVLIVTILFKVFGK